MDAAFRCEIVRFTNQAVLVYTSCIHTQESDAIAGNRDALLSRCLEFLHADIRSRTTDLFQLPSDIQASLVQTLLRLYGHIHNTQFCMVLTTGINGVSQL